MGFQEDEIVMALKATVNNQEAAVSHGHHYFIINNCIAKMEVGCLKHPGASTIGSQLLDEDCSHGWQILATQPWAPTQQEEQAPVTL